MLVSSVFFFFLNDLNLHFFNHLNMTSMHGALERAGHASDLVFTPPPVCWQWFALARHVAMHLIWLEAHLFSPVCIGTGKAGVLI